MRLLVDATKYPLRMEGGLSGMNFLPVIARVTEEISTIPTIEVDFFCNDTAVALSEVVGQTVHLVADSDDGSDKRWFRGTCTSAEFVRRVVAGGHYRLTARPWLWYLTRRTDQRIFQNKKVIDIIKEILGEHGFSGDIQVSLTENYEEREYCVQYRETDFDFISRLMEEEGIFYYFDHSGDTEKMVIRDGMSHVPNPNYARLDFSTDIFRSTVETVDPVIFEWNGGEGVQSGKVRLEDYNFEKSTANLQVESAVDAGSYSKAADIQYDYPGHYREPGLGEKRATVRMQAEASKHQVVSGLSDGIHIATGHSLGVNTPLRDTETDEILITACRHDLMQLSLWDDIDFKGSVEDMATIGVDARIPESHIVEFKGIDSSKQYRAPLITPWPKVSGIHTAVVTGPSGEEIHTDKYGRIKVQFHWDLDGEYDDKTTCWVRTMMPWTGKNWGAIAIPRIGQEVVIDFEEGDPDRPLCVGMLYNDKTMPPYSLPDNKSQSGIKTNSTKGGGGFNELMMEDKKGEELVRFQSEKDYKEIVKNNAEITIGLEKKDEGNLDLTVHNNVTEVIKEGDYKETVEMGDHTTDIDQGDHNTTVTQGDMKVDVTAGKINVTAGTSIELKVGASSIFMNKTSITLKSVEIKVQGSAKVDVTSPLTTVKADTLLTLSGKMVKIN